MRLSAAILSTRLSLLALGAVVVAAAPHSRPSLGEEPVGIAQARAATQTVAAGAIPPDPVPKPGRAQTPQSEIKPQTKPEPNWPKTVPDAKAEAEAAAAPPDVWSPEEIAEAKALCTQTLNGVAAVVLPADPIKNGECGTPAPVELISIGSNPEVALSPPVTVTCDMVAKLAQWIKEDVQPLARRHFKEKVVRLSTMSSYSCRNAYGRKRSRLSEHGRANAIDLGRFITDGGTEIDLLANWGPTERDIRAAIAAALKAEEQRRAAEKKAAEEKKTAERAKATGKTPAANEPAAPAVTHPQIVQLPPNSAPSAKPSSSAPERPAPLPDRLGFRHSTLIEGIPPPRSRNRETTAKTAPPPLEAPSSLGKPIPAAPAATPLTPPIDKKGEFLRAIHSAACKHFGTVLGPEANEAHRNHFHLDMAERRRGNFCE